MRFWGPVQADALTAEWSSSEADGFGYSSRTQGAEAQHPGMERLAPRDIGDAERAYVGTWEVTVDGENPWAFDMTLDPDGSFVTASDGRCVMRGGWEVDAESPSFTARGLCGDLAMSISTISMPTPDQFVGELTMGRGPSNPVSAVHRSDG